MRKIVRVLGLVLAWAFAPGARNAYAEERPAVRAEHGSDVHAEQGSVAVGGNIINSTINQENPETPRLLRETIAAKDPSEEKRREAGPNHTHRAGENFF